MEVDGSRNVAVGSMDRALLICGVIAPLVYIATDVVAASLWPGYSLRDQTISELNAIGAPTRQLTVVMGLVGYGILLAFGVGVWRMGAGNRPLRIAGLALTLFSAQALWAVPFASMQLRGAERTFSDTLHLVDGAFAGLLLATVIGFSAAALDARFRAYSVGALLLVLFFSAWSGMDYSNLVADRPTPWLGVKERVAVYSYQAWLVVFGATLLRRERLTSSRLP